MAEMQEVVVVEEEEARDRVAYSTLAAMTRRDYKCPHCQEIYEELYHIGDPAEHEHCPQCGARMRRYFGSTCDVRVNYGFRPARYATTEDQRIAQYQFEHL